ncbi:uncharacterized protein LOC117781035 [Drosophila innubila]|uniref:uncharacterized protein LOC117781035 n=1 Tax=Drosophila innubila TaxID=198719 RepID=UPI00148B9AFA|nr:uncharacterized protein LOC117781035 [Drosophila innubila]
MGASLDSKMSCEKPLAVVNPMPADDNVVNIEEDEEEKANVTLHLFHYRQQIGLKSHHVVKWASAKLLLTEELLKQQQQRLQPNLKISLDELDSDAAWAERQLAMLTDDEDDNEDDDTENRPPRGTPLDSELNHLMNYRMKLRNTIVQVAQEKLRKREKTKIKRLKRRTLISSKKPSNKDKYRA